MRRQRDEGVEVQESVRAETRADAAEESVDDGNRLRNEVNESFWHYSRRTHWRRVKARTRSPTQSSSR